MRTGSSFRVATLALVLACGGCGGSGSSNPTCTPPAPDSPAAAGAAESALIARGRADADFAHAFGADSQKLLDAADAQRTALLQAEAAALGVALPAVGTPTTGCSTPTATVKRS